MLSGVAAQQQHRGGSYILGNQWCPNKLLILKKWLRFRAFGPRWGGVGLSVLCSSCNILHVLTCNINIYGHVFPGYRLQVNDF